MGKFLLAAAFATTLCACKTAAPDSGYVKDIGVVNAGDAKTMVLYGADGKVYLKACKPPIAPPLNRECSSDGTPKYLELNAYLTKLPYDTGAYERSDNGLTFVAKALKDAQDAVAGGNQNAARTVALLEPIKANLDKILAIRDNLDAQQSDLTYYEYQDEYSKLLVPFGEASGGTLVNEMTFVRIPKGTFLMGSPSEEEGRGNDELQHRVTISYDYFMQTTPVTQEQWYKIMGDNPSKFTAEQDCPGEHKEVNGVALCPNNPVEQVSSNDILQFSTRMNSQNDGFHYRLPSEAEWEYAARAGTTGPYSVPGSLQYFAWYAENSGGRTHPVAKLQANRFGLYDVHGNVGEWVMDAYSGYEYWPSSVTNPVASLDRSLVVIRGGGWDLEARHCRSADRRSAHPDSRHSGVGFRLRRFPKR